ncbi:hypothetical protein GCM10007063_02350 [Lentibacillus kapialis]|uniref:Uncharacterized protein n=1 Tax=Lentibacillus kapialis TaxID=340214 RepID=A0A917PM26_9BACI|nr:hypothetical protein [Lentibacillus kapialis]GGJ83379.1 hypothetical protein GCM10007063_02350 [Lentibacillus kapialis]
MEVILIILAIVASISGLFKDKSDTDTPVPQRKNNQSEPTPAPSGSGQTRSSTENETETQTTVSASSIEEQQDEQRKQLAERMNTTKHQYTEQEHDAIISHKTRKSDTDLTDQQLKLRKNMNNNLTRSGLINGVIMSEVLGQSRAVKPYRSIITQRKK